MGQPTDQAAHRWEDGSGIFAGRDLQAGGTWLGIRPHRLALVTNVRDPDGPVGRRSRGDLPVEFLTSDDPPQAFVDQLDPSDYSPFNLLLMAHDTLMYFGSHPQPTQHVLSAGIYSLSNAQLNTPWPKCLSVTRAMRRSVDAAYEAMLETQTYPDALLPNTGVPRDWESRLSSARIEGENYATRCTTQIQYDGQHFNLTETTWPLAGQDGGQVTATV